MWVEAHVAKSQVISDENQIDFGFGGQNYKRLLYITDETAAIVKSGGSISAVKDKDSAATVKFTMPWTVILNSEKLRFCEMTLTDELITGLRLMTDPDWVITNSAGTDVSSDWELEITGGQTEDELQKLVWTYSGAPTAETFKLTFSTETVHFKGAVRSDRTSYYRNTIVMAYKEAADRAVKTRNASGTSGFLSNNWLAKTGTSNVTGLQFNEKNGAYEARMPGWKVTVNAGKLLIKDAVLYDRMNDYMKIDFDTLKVYQGTSTGGQQLTWAFAGSSEEAGADVICQGDSLSDGYRVYTFTFKTEDLYNSYYFTYDTILEEYGPENADFWAANGSKLCYNYAGITGTNVNNGFYGLGAADQTITWSGTMNANAIQVDDTMYTCEIYYLEYGGAEWLSKGFPQFSSSGGTPAYQEGDMILVFAFPNGIPAARISYSFKTSIPDIRYWLNAPTTTNTISLYRGGSYRASGSNSNYSTISSSITKTVSYETAAARIKYTVQINQAKVPLPENTRIIDFFTASTGSSTPTVWKNTPEFAYDRDNVRIVYASGPNSGKDLEEDTYKIDWCEWRYRTF